MVGDRGTRRACVILAACCVGCLEAPPSGAPVDGNTPDAAARPVADAGAGACPAFARPPFNDTDQWIETEPAMSTVDATVDQVVLVLSEGTGTNAYVDLHSVAASGIDETTLTAELMVSNASGALAGISWHASTGELDYYDLAVSEGILYARYKTAAGEGTDACEGACPPYDQTGHRLLRLQARGGFVYYQASPEGAEWLDIGSTPSRGLQYRALLFGQAQGVGSMDMTVVAAEWVDCLP